MAEGADIKRVLNTKLKKGKEDENEKSLEERSRKSRSRPKMEGGGERRVIKKTSHPGIAHGRRCPMPCLGRSFEEVE